MNVIKLIYLSVFATALSVAVVPIALAQDQADDQLGGGGESQNLSEVEDIEEIVVTGSRLRRSTYSSISPLQVISANVSREVGLVDATSILQESTSASGQQIDLTFTGLVLDDGPGATSVDLRGLGASRSLLLLNGRRMAPGGVEGAPVNPDPQLIPAILVDHYDILLDGASSIYGSDAVAGVANVVLRKDFDGAELQAFSRLSDHGAGNEDTLAFSWGKNSDRGFIGVGGSYLTIKPTVYADLPWTSGCERNHEITESGELRSQDVFYSTVYGQDFDDCALGSLAGRVSVPGAGSIYHTPGQSNGGWPNFSESSLFGAFGVDGDGDGDTDINFRDYDLNGRNQNAHFIPDIERYSFMAYGEYTFEGDTNFTPYFEALYSGRKTYIRGEQGQLFPSVPANNPFNICNPEAEGGVDCNEAYNTLIRNPNVIAATQNAFGCDPTSSCDQLRETGQGAVPSTPIVSVRGDRNIVDVDLNMLRLVGGFDMDLPFLNVGSLSDWALDVSLSYSKTSGTSSRPGVRSDRLELALGDYSTTNTPCENDTGESLAGDAAPGCVPVNLFAPSLYQNVIGDFATPAERDYLFDNRDFDTEYKQTILQAFINGTLFSLPAGDVIGGIGLEYRNDDIKSIPDQVARDGLLWGFFSDGGAEGDKDTKEIFTEIELPLLGNMRFAEELTLNTSYRWTDDELYGSSTTYAVKLGYRPVSSLLLRATLGTSFRAPNLREVFLRPQTGFLNINDPCIVPEDAQNELTGEYSPANETRDDLVLQNCRAQGVDPTTFLNNGFSVTSVEVAAGGSPTLKAEESEARSIGFSWEQPFTNAFNLSIGMTYYEYEIENTIIEPSGQFIVNDCFFSTTGNSAFCDRITREDDPDQPFLELLDRGFINRDVEKLRGIDVNLSFDDTVTIFGRPIEIGAELNANHPKSRTTLFIDDEGNRDFDEFAREWGYPNWRGQMTWRAGWDDWRITWRTRYVSSVHQDRAGVDAFDDAINGSSNTCLGLPDDELCRDYGDASNYYEQTLSLYYSRDYWSIGMGIDNLLDEKPPIVDGSEVSSINNTPRGYGYDVLGRTFFVDVRYNFGGGQ